MKSIIFVDLWIFKKLIHKYFFMYINNINQSARLLAIQYSMTIYISFPPISEPKFLTDKL